MGSGAGPRLWARRPHHGTCTPPQRMYPTTARVPHHSTFIQRGASLQTPDTEQPSVLTFIYILKKKNQAIGFRPVEPPCADVAPPPLRAGSTSRNRGADTARRRWRARPLCTECAPTARAGSEPALPVGRLLRGHAGPPPLLSPAEPGRRAWARGRLCILRVWPLPAQSTGNAGSIAPGPRRPTHCQEAPHWPVL